MSDFYEFEHECDAMPDEVRFCKINGCTSSQFTIGQFTIDEYMCGVASNSTTFYGFRYCPYCGEDMENKAVKR